MRPNESNDFGLDLRWTPGPYGAPRQDGSDVRWSGIFNKFASTMSEEDFDDFWNVLGQTWDQGSREHGEENPFWQDWRPLK